MTRARLCLGIMLLAAPAGSTTPCMGPHQLGEAHALELLSVSIDGVPLTDVSAYSEYQVEVRGEVVRKRLDGITNYVRFGADRAQIGDFGREQRESLAEFYPVY